MQRSPWSLILCGDPTQRGDHVRKSVTWTFSMFLWGSAGAKVISGYDDRLVSIPESVYYSVALLELLAGLLIHGRLVLATCMLLTLLFGFGIVLSIVGRPGACGCIGTQMLLSARGERMLGSVGGLLSCITWWLASVSPLGRVRGNRSIRGVPE